MEEKKHVFEIEDKLEEDSDEPGSDNLTVLVDPNENPGGENPGGEDPGDENPADLSHTNPEKRDLSFLLSNDYPIYKNPPFKLSRGNLHEKYRVVQICKYFIWLINNTLAISIPRSSTPARIRVWCGKKDIPHSNRTDIE